MNDYSTIFGKVYTGGVIQHEENDEGDQTVEPEFDKFQQQRSLSPAYLVPKTQYLSKNGSIVRPQRYK